ncbi:MAG: thiamine pyrophosphate-dependent dehydrogenase E1 component subunit alpha, partial [Phycisphaerae bacterium]|nr:thiamine pyrophosphate-dependent dehydrogenase E1 component subunit alpha [Phycisphaerae bacterium]
MYSKEFLIDLYKTLYSIRVFETRCIKLYRQGLIRGYFHPYLGEEAIATGVCAALEEKDYIVSTHRGHGHCIARGAELRRMVAELLGKETGYCAGRGGSMHIADIAKGNMGANGIVGAGIPLGVGAALGSSIRGDKQVTAVFFSDGATNNGVFAEAMNLAAIWDLPLIMVLENNHYAVSTPIEKVCRTKDICERGKGYGVESFVVDGNDVLEVYKKTKAAAERCRNGKGPVLMECKTYRHAGHHVNDPGAYMPKDKLDYYKSRDPVESGRKYLLNKGKATEDQVAAIEADID